MTGVVAVTAEVVAVNVPVVLPAAFVKVAGTFRFAELLARVIDAPPEPALADSVTVHVLVAFAERLAGTQATPETTTGATRPTNAVCTLLPRVAVIVAP